MEHTSLDPTADFLTYVNDFSPGVNGMKVDEPLPADGAKTSASMNVFHGMMRNHLNEAARRRIWRRPPPDRSFLMAIRTSDDPRRCSYEFGIGPGLYVLFHMLSCY